MTYPKQTPSDSDTRSASRGNSTHRKRLARQFAERSSRSYASALEIVARAAESGCLPDRLDAAGMRHALCTLLALEAATPEQPAVAVPGPGKPENLYLVRPFLAVLRQVWQGRVTKEPHAGASRFMIDSNPASPARDVELFLLERNGYITAPLPQGDDWAIAWTTDLGDRVLAANQADTHKFLDGLPTTLLMTQVSDDANDRRPYVGEGADGARRSAEVDRSEADCLAADDPRRELVLASAARWERQADRLEAVEEPPG